MNTTVELIKNLRKETGAGLQECRLTLEECNYDYQHASAILKEKMIETAARLADRKVSQGWLKVYSHGDGRLAVIVEINTETDFAAKSEPVRAFGHEVALQIAAARPLHVREEEIPAGVLAELTRRTTEEARSAGKPPAITERMIEGRIKKYKEDKVLLNQPYIRDETTTIAQLAGQVSARIGENVQIRRFVRWELESIESN